MVKNIVAYKTSDGGIFFNEYAARNHENSLKHLPFLQRSNISLMYTGKLVIPVLDELMSDIKEIGLDCDDILTNIVKSRIFDGIVMTGMKYNNTLENIDVVIG